MLCCPFIRLLLSITLLLKCCYTQERLSQSQSRARRDYDFYKIELDPKKHDLQFFNFVTVSEILSSSLTADTYLISLPKRPDIDAPKWDVKVYNKNALSPGCWFVAPYTIVEQSDPDESYVGPYIYDGNGELVWSGAPTFNGYAVFDFKVSKVDHRDMLSMIWLHGNSSVLIDNNYRTYKTVPTGLDTESTNIHDFQIIDGHKALYLTREQKWTSKENSLAVGFEGQCYVLFTGFEERDLSSGELLFRWSPEGRIGLDESVMKGPTGDECRSAPWDYL